MITYYLILLQISVMIPDSILIQGGTMTSKRNTQKGDDKELRSRLAAAAKSEWSSWSESSRKAYSVASRMAKQEANEISRGGPDGGHKRKTTGG